MIAEQQFRAGKKSHEPSFSLDDYAGYSDLYSKPGFGYSDDDDDYGYGLDDYGDDDYDGDDYDDGGDDLDESSVVKVTKAQLRRIILEITPGAAGIAAMGGGTPADRGMAAAAAENPGHDGEASLLDLDDYEILENCVNKLIGYGYTKEDVAGAFNAMMETM